MHIEATDVFVRQSLLDHFDDLFVASLVTGGNFLSDLVALEFVNFCHKLPVVSGDFQDDFLAGLLAIWVTFFWSLLSRVIVVLVDRLGGHHFFLADVSHVVG